MTSRHRHNHQIISKFHRGPPRPPQEPLQCQEPQHPPQPFTTFHLFPQLPWELQQNILDLAVKPRNVEFELIKPKWGISGHQAMLPNMRPKLPVPPLLHTNHECREYLLKSYKLFHSGGGYVLPFGYFNFEIDTLEFGSKWAGRRDNSSYYIDNKTGRGRTASGEIEFGIFSRHVDPQEIQKVKRLTIRSSFFLSKYAEDIDKKTFPFTGLEVVKILLVITSEFQWEFDGGRKDSILQPKVVWEDPNEVRAKSEPRIWSLMEFIKKKNPSWKPPRVEIMSDKPEVEV